jgi:signal transduction histidine kinase
MEMSPAPDEFVPSALGSECELTAVVAHLHGAMEAERVQLSRVLHDDLGGLLVSALMDLGWVDQHRSGADLHDRLNRVRTALGAAIDLKRNIIEGLRPSLLDNFGLSAACRWYVAHRAKEAGVVCVEKYLGIEPAWRPEALAPLFRLVQDFVTVILAEPCVTTIKIEFAVEGSALLLDVAHAHSVCETIDTFEHFPVQMSAIGQRINSLGGALAVERMPAGVAMHMRFPVDRVMLPG